MVSRRRFRCTAVGASTVTLTPQGPESEPGGVPGAWGALSGAQTLILTTTVTPDPEVWKTFALSGREYLVEIEVVS